MNAPSGRRRPWERQTAEWLVIVLVVVALMAGWGLKSYAESRTARHIWGEAGVTLSYPLGWLASSPEPDTLRFRDTRAGGVAPALEVRACAAAEGQPISQTLILQADALALSRAQELLAYRILESDATGVYRGAPLLRVSYVYVREEGDPFQQHLPTVMLGEDLLVYQQGRVFVFSLQAAEDGFASLRGHLRSLLDTAVFGAR